MKTFKPNHLTLAYLEFFSAEDGTHVYLDPEYNLSNTLNEKSDGIVLLEIITSRPVSSMIHEEIYICQWVSFMVEKGDIKSIVDPWLNGNFGSNSVWKAVEIALAVELARKNPDTESEDSIEMRPVKFTTEMRPLAR
ncbi:senescence-induced receptor-like serine/threonine-protein kinase [Prunus yedoensis var. nudiflora]|uniref:Senescence-induced receptor-like serine/threonine-protein kinase n=1 Tax=Prunus yedoensis var. nudiflora TaxID=2094558 RepID=A0A314XLS0_PRUYE|nr:senescence-induced receptor-like serine/threonine-protein kinase [Prunus yedoensis var. nudiflora]